MESGLRAVLYVSELSGQDVGSVGSILATARRNNAVYGQTGVLVFDGERFCQYVEGETSKVRALLRNLLADNRHENVQILADLPISKRAFQQFRTGYSDVEDMNALKEMTTHFSGDAVRRFLEMVESCDIEE